MPSNHRNASESTPLLHHIVPSHVHPDGESGRSGFHPGHFIRVSWRSGSKVAKYVNLLWPLVPVAIILATVTPGLPLVVFAFSYVAMIPVANLLGFAGQEFARKMSKVSGILIETSFGSIVEIILFLVLIVKHTSAEGSSEHGNLIPVIQAAILGSILANLLLCLGACFYVGGLRQASQKFHASISEVGTGLFFIFYNARSQHSIFDEVLEADEHHDLDRSEDLAKPKFTFTECIIALVLSLVLVTLLAVFLVERIEDVVESGVPDQFLGLILLPLVEKAAEHLTAVDEAWDGQINFALFHCIGPSIQTALFNAPLVVIVGWILGKGMDLNFEIFMIVLLVLSIVVVGNFLRDGESNYLEGALLIIIYIIIAVASWYYPNPDVATSNGLANSS
ncbi:uncharacterized protein N0V89_002150 [Didymosphaeria variabile]|uniref:Sodium/calcium exchanger membrane region domain-containing protein n=1 Tax=Didymosphaeria variabile TaxID=1932322 RepID=A0A9W8XS54_9PLEO|nr:uncharacterized protein N0V89_002150 [Didymosphaeria variabile]KAJ4357574.1 hypothetical protein N0V89_002150 [Didymosphaeria variabile]